MKNEIKVGDPVFFLYAQHLQGGIAKRINKKTISVSYTTWGWNGYKGVDVERVKLVAKDRVVNELDEFTIVHELDIGVEGRYYITHTEFPRSNALGNNWYQPFTYVTK